MVSTKTRRVLYVLSALLLLLTAFAPMLISATEAEAPAVLAAPAEDASEAAGFDAWDYIDNYSDNVDSDENFDENFTAAITEARQDIPVYATWLALLPPIIAIALALITTEV